VVEGDGEEGIVKMAEWTKRRQLVVLQLTIISSQHRQQGERAASFSSLLFKKQQS